MWLAAWCNSGTLSIYAATLGKPLVLEPCGYLANIDHENFRYTYLALQGYPKEIWQDSVVLRRVLYPILSYPFMEYFGYVRGGFIFNVLLHTLTLIVLCRFITKRLGWYVGVLVAWIFASYPGIVYWIGLPYSYAIIIPAVVFAGIAIVLYDEIPTRKRASLTSFAIGILSTGYDLLPYFGLSLLICIAIKKKWLDLFIATSFLLAPTLLVSIYFYVLQINPVNNNTQSYLNIIKSYLGIINDPLFSWKAWWLEIKDIHIIFMQNFFASNFFVLPTVFLLFWLIGKLYLKVPFYRVNLIIFISIFLVFLFNNMAPPYPGWQLRGFWVARIYQPLFIVMIFYIAVVSHEMLIRPKLFHFLRFLIVMLVGLNCIIVFSPILRLPLADRIYHEFYGHALSGPKLTKTLDKYGRRPMFICKRGRY